MAISNTAKPSASMTNTAKPSSASITGTSKPDFSPLWVASVLPWQLDTPWLLFGSISNTEKPS